jgi:tRNA pseudouridine38-40 synthase
MDIETILRGTNALVPEDIHVLEASEAAPDFSARYSARERGYSYTIALRRAPLRRRESWFVGYKLDTNIMQRCANVVIGDHQFASFCKNAGDEVDFRCIVRNAEWKQTGFLLTFHIAANRFLHGMVRALVGTMVDVGRGHMRFEEFCSLLNERNRSAAGMSAPPQGLVLESVTY